VTYQACCTALASVAGIPSLASTCSDVGRLSTLGPMGDGICAQVMSAMRQVSASMPGMPAACR
jgi:hypothetical protein